MTPRIKLLAVTGLITDRCAMDMHNVNEVRNNLAHYQPTIGYDMSQVKELSSDVAFRQCKQKGLRAAREIYSILLPDEPDLPHSN